MDSKVFYMDSSQALDRQLVAVVRDAMRALGRSQRDISEATGIPLVTLSRRLSGAGKGFTVEELLAVADALGISLVELAVRAERRSAQAPAA